MTRPVVRSGHWASTLALGILLVPTLCGAFAGPAPTPEAARDDAGAAKARPNQPSQGSENAGQVSPTNADAPPAAPATERPTDFAPPSRIAGIDVSQFQGDIDWQAVKASGIVFAFARALEGETIHDSTFAANWEGMKDAGVIRGAYDFYVADDPPAAQVEIFTGLVTLEPGDLVPMVDIEQGSIGSAAPPDLVANFHTYLDLMEQHYGAKPIIYTDPRFWNEHMDDSFGDYPLWIAEYGVDSPRPPKGWEDWVLWQHSDNGSVPGIDGAVDLDVFNGGLEELARYRVPLPAPE